MVRPVASDENKALGLKFASTVTTEVSNQGRNVIARSGRLSIFSALRECCPSAIRNNDPWIGRYGMTEIEFNKVLERNGFSKIRDRGAGAPVIEFTDSENGKAARYFFANRKWRNPSDPEDLEVLKRGWEALQNTSYIFSGQCTLERFLAICAQFHEQWERELRRSTSDTNRPAMHSSVSSDCSETEPPTKKQKLNLPAINVNAPSIYIQNLVSSSLPARLEMIFANSISAQGAAWPKLASLRQDFVEQSSSIQRIKEEEKVQIFPRCDQNDLAAADILLAMKSKSKHAKQRDGGEQRDGDVVCF
mmetsp:Transcript_15950/g.36449  ORF Transcript_15950/g.36449 Transcript_15950/m.36449 type:complete len:305 (-) Transcript_15950:58-972(-)